MFQKIHPQRMMELKSLLPILFAIITLTGVGIGALCYVCRKFCRRRKKHDDRYQKKKRKYTKENTGYPKLPLLQTAAKDIQIIQMLHKEQYSTRPVLAKQAIPEELPSAEERRRKDNGVSRAYSNCPKRYPPVDRVYTVEPISCTEMYYPQAQSPHHQLHNFHHPLAQSTSAPHLVDNSPTTKSTSKKRSLSGGRHDRRTPVTGPLEAREWDQKRDKRSRSIASPVLGHTRPNLLKGKYRSEGNLSFVTSFDFSDSSTQQRTITTPVAVIYPADGTLEYSLHYDAIAIDGIDVLSVTIHRLNDIVVNPTNYIGILQVTTDDSEPKSKPYIKEDGNGTLEVVSDSKVGYLVYASLLPSSSFKRHTSVVLGTTNTDPTTISFNESFELTEYSLIELNKMTLCFHILSRFGPDHEPILIGEIKRSLTDLDVGKSMPCCDKISEIETELEIETPGETLLNLGELIIVLSYDLMKQQIIAKIVEAVRLPKHAVTGNPNVSVKTSLYCHNKRIYKQTSSIQRKQKHPTFNETFYFDLSKDRVNACDLLFEVRHHGPVHRSVIGYVHVGTSAGGSGANQWKQLLDFAHFEQVSHQIVPTKPITLL